MKNSSTIVLRIAIKNKPLMMSGGGGIQTDNRSFCYADYSERRAA